MYVEEVVGEFEALGTVGAGARFSRMVDTATRVARQIVSPTLQRDIDRQLARVVLERDDVLEVVDGELAGGGDS